VIQHKEELLLLLRLLRDKTFSKRGFSWTGKLLSSMLLTLTHTYPLENKFVNPEEWNSEGKSYVIQEKAYPGMSSKEFRRNHHRHWGKLFRPEEIKVRSV
jgi:proteasome activator subunit 4